MSLFTAIEPLDVYDNVPLIGADEAVKCDGVYHNKFSNEVIGCLHPKLNTYNELFNNAVVNFGPKKCLGYRTFDRIFQQYSASYSSLTFNQVQRIRSYLGSGILHVLSRNQFNLYNAHKHNWRRYNLDDMSFILTIYADNRYEWILTDLACVAYSITNTVLYDTLDDSSMVHILSITKSPVVVCSAAKIGKIKNMKAAEKLPFLVCIILMDNEVSLYIDKDLGLEVWGFKDIISLGRKHKLDQMPPKKESVYTISFTSGTTSHPKGVVLTHEQAVAANTFLMSTNERVSNGRTLVFLPLAHIYERQTSAFAMCSGYMLGFPKPRSGDIVKDLVDDLHVYKPHYVSLVPRILNKLQSEIKVYLEKINDFKLNQLIEQKKSNHALFNGNRGLASTDSYPPYVKLRKKFGFSHLKWVNTASAPANAATIEYVKASLNVGLKQLYGATETFGAITSTLAHDTATNSSGIISIGCQFKLGANDELLVRGAAVFPRYYKNEVATAEAIQDGWYHTGDIASIGPKGDITIIDRAKNVFKMSQGEFISPERLENIYMAGNPDISGICIIGGPTKSFLVGILNMKGTYNSPREKVQLLHKLNGNVNLNRYERLQNVHVGENLLTDVLTPTFKLKRKVVEETYKDVIDQLYAEGSLYSKI